MITSARLFIRPFTREDAPLLLSLNSDPEVQRYTGDIVMKTKAEAEERIEKYLEWMESHGMARFATFLRSDGAFVGWCGIIPFPDCDGELGYRFKAEYWGQGYGTEAAIAVLEWARDVHRLKHIIGRAMPENEASCRILLRCGMQYVGQATDEHDGSLLNLYEIRW